MNQYFFKEKNPFEKRVRVLNEQTMIKLKPPNCYRVLVTRDNTSFKALSNPFKLNYEYIKNNKKLAIGLFRYWFTYMLEMPTQNTIKETFQKLLNKLINENQDIELVCNCKPDVCHADIIRECLINKAKKHHALMQDDTSEPMEIEY